MISLELLEYKRRYWNNLASVLPSLMLKPVEKYIWDRIREIREIQDIFYLITDNQTVGETWQLSIISL